MKVHKIKFSKILILFLVSFCSAKNLSLLSLHDPQNRELLDVVISDSVMIITGNLNGTEFYDISDSSNPVHLANLSIPMGNRSLPNFEAAIFNDYLYLSSRHRGLAIVNISDPTNPQHVGMVDEPGGSDYSYDGLEIKDSILYAAAHEHGVIQYDLSDPASPTFMGTIQAENAWDVLFKDSLIIIQNGEYGLKIYEIGASGNSQVLIGDTETPGATKDIQLDGDLLYVAMGSAGVGVYDISDLNDLVLLDIYDTSGLANRISLFNGKVAVSDWLDVKILEFDGAELDLVGYKNTARRTMAINTIGNIIYSAEWRLLQVMEYGEISGPDIDLNTYEANFPQIEIGESDTAFILITNNGNQSLEFITEYFTHPDFITTINLDEIEAGNSVEMDIIYTKSNNNATGTLNFQTNDNDEEFIDCAIVGNYDGVNVGMTAPDFNLPIVANGSDYFQLSSHFGEIVVITFFSPG